MFRYAPRMDGASGSAEGIQAHDEQTGWPFSRRDLIDVVFFVVLLVSCCVSWMLPSLDGAPCGPSCAALRMMAFTALGVILYTQRHSIVACGRRSCFVESKVVTNV